MEDLISQVWESKMILFLLEPVGVYDSKDIAQVQSPNFFFSIKLITEFE